MARKYDNTILSLLHFNYPYYGEAGDGLKDEVSGETWTRAGNARLAGNEAPCDVVITGTPCFGYRCLHTEGNASYITATNTSGIWNVTGTNTRELEVWIRPTASSAGNIFAWTGENGDDLTLSKDTNNAIVLTDGQSTITTSGTLSLSVWQHLRVTISNGNVNIRVDGSSYGTGTLNGNYFAKSVRLGGITGQLDEFVFRNAATLQPDKPAEEYKANASYTDFGGLGDARHGSLTITADSVINSYAIVKNMNGKTLTTSAWTNGLLGAPKAGDEIMLHASAKIGTDDSFAGKFTFARVASISGTTLNLTENIDGNFPLSDILKSWTVQAVLVPQVRDFTINAGCTVTPYAWSADRGGGIVVLRVREKADIRGSILTYGYGAERGDFLQVTHATLPEHFIMNRGGNLMLICGGTLTAGVNARLGASWDGSVKGGSGVRGKIGKPGGAGYGGAGSGDTDNAGTGGNGGVGGGGGGGDQQTGGNAGTSGTGGYANAWGTIYAGGTQGKTAGGASPKNTASTGGGGAGGNAGTFSPSSYQGGYAGANIIILCRTLDVDDAAISTGGGVVTTARAYSGGGGGTGFCYIACEEMSE